MKKNSKQVITIYMLISFLLFVLGIEMYFYLNVKQWEFENFITKIVGEIDNLYFFSQGILIYIFLLGTVFALMAVRRASRKGISILVMLLNVACLLVNCALLYGESNPDKKKIISEKENDTQEQESAIPIPQIDYSKYTDVFLMSYDADASWTKTYERSQKEGWWNLATFSTKEELDYVTTRLLDLFDRDYVFYVGGRREQDSKEYYWIDQDNQSTAVALNSPDSWLADCWEPGEPSFTGENGEEETVLCLIYNESLGKWMLADIPDNFLNVYPEYRGKAGYIVEAIEGMSE